MKKWWLVVLVLAVAGVGLFFLSGGSEPIQVTTEVLTSGRVEQTVTCTGIVESAKVTSVYLPLPCVIKQVCVNEGDRVEKGAVLARVDKQATLERTENEALRMVLAAMAEEVTAPEKGVVVGVNVIEGAPTEAGTPCVLLALEKDLQVRISLREKDLQVVRQGMSARLSGDGLSKVAYTGSLVDISAVARTDTGAGTVIEGVVKLDDGQADPSMRLGLSARVLVITSVTDSGVLVPHEAVLSDSEGQYVYLLKNGCAHRQNLRVAGQVSAGVLLADRSLEGAKVICNPDTIRHSGVAVEEKVP